MSTLNANPDASDITTLIADSVHAPMPSGADVPASTSTSPPESAQAGHWSDSLRGAVRDNPYAAVGTAAVIGMLLVRLTR